MFNAANALSLSFSFMMHIRMHHNGENGHWILCLLLRNDVFSFLDLYAHNGSLAEITPKYHLNKIVMEMPVSVFAGMPQWCGQ